jgi:hypothetical protein
MHSVHVLMKCSQVSTGALKHLPVNFVVAQIEHSVFFGRSLCFGFTTPPDLTRTVVLRRDDVDARGSSTTAGLRAAGLRFV